MDKMETILVAFLSFLLVFCQRLADGCSCAPVHPQDHFCTAGFVIKAMILKREPWSSIPGSSYVTDYMYTVQVDRVFKGNGLKEGMNIAVRTASSDGMCGNLGLQNGMKYVLTGSKYGGQFGHGLCDLSIEWEQVTHFQRQGFRNFYKQGCNDCEIRSPFSYMRSTKPAAQQCSYDFPSFMYDAGNCELKHSACIQQSKGSCGWLEKPEYKECVLLRQFTEEGSGFL